MLKNAQPWLARASAVRAAEGTSIMQPKGVSSRKVSPRSRSSSLASSTWAMAASHSSGPPTMGNTTDRLAWAAARSKARSCIRNSSGWVRQKRRPRSPSAGFGPMGTRSHTGARSSPMSKVRTVTGRPAAACRQFL